MLGSTVNMMDTRYMITSKYCLITKTVININSVCFLEQYEMSRKVLDGQGLRDNTIPVQSGLEVGFDTGHSREHK